MDNLEYRKEIWAILKEFKESKTMTYTEVTDKIIAIPTPKKENPYEGVATREDETKKRIRRKFRKDGF